MSSFCPICKNSITQKTKKCKVCDFSDLHKEFITKEDAQDWFDTVVLPYRNRWEKQRLEKNIEIVCPVCKEVLTKADKKCKNCGFDELDKEFINKTDGELWLEEVVIPYREKYEAEKNEKGGFIIDNGVLIKYEGTDQVVNIPDGVTVIGEMAFIGSNVNEVIMPNSVRIISSRALSLYSLESVTLSQNLVEIGEAAFMGCNLKDISFPESLRIIKKWAFSSAFLSNFMDDTGINIYIPQNVSFIGENAFFGIKNDDNINEIKVDERNSHYVSLNGAIYDKNMKELIYIPSNTEEYTFPNEVEKAYLFQHNRHLKKICFSNNVKQLPKEMFDHCTSLEYVRLPEQIEELSEGLFKACFALTNIELPNSIKIIGVAAFCRTNIRNIVLPNKLLKINNGAFSYCIKLKEITIPDTVTYMGYSTFCDCIELKKVELSNSITEIGKYVFKGCTSLKEINIPHSVTYIKNNAFEGCKNLTKIVIPKNVERIDNNVFLNCKKLTIHCEQHSYANKYAIEHNIPVQFID